MNALLAHDVPSTDDGYCPDCSTSLANVQGLAACADCGWVSAQYR